MTSKNSSTREVDNGREGELSSSGSIMKISPSSNLNNNSNFTFSPADR